MEAQLLRFRRKDTKTTVTDQEHCFERVILGEMKTLRTAEHRLKRLYARLSEEPRLRTRFLLGLADLQGRADRLESILNPRCSFGSNESEMAASR